MYLCMSGCGNGQPTARSAGSGASTVGRNGARSSPMSTRASSPAASAPPGSSSPALCPPKVTVRSARTWTAPTAPVVASTPVGTSTAMTRCRRALPVPEAAACQSAMNVSSGARSDPEAPVPRIPSMTSSARAVRGADSAPSGSMSPPAARSAAAPSGWRRPRTSTTVTRAPRRLRSAPANSASPPLLPAPARTTTRAPVTHPRASIRSRRQTAARPAAAVRMSTGPRPASSSGASAARIAAAG